MRASCISHPEREQLIVIRKWQVEFCEGNRCAAALMSFFEYWHNIKMDMSQKNLESNDVQEKHGDMRTQDESLVQFHTEQQLSNGILGIYKKDKIKKSLDFLRDKNVIKIFRNPNPRYKFDKTNHFLFNPPVLINYLSSSSRTKTGLPSPENRSRSSENRRAIPEITTETTTETTTKKKNVTNQKNDLDIPKKDKPKFSDEALELSETLAKHILERRENFTTLVSKKKQTTIDRWAIDIDKLLRIDKISYLEAQEVLDWCQGDGFWADNILSGEAFRKQYNRLALGMKNKKIKTIPRQSHPQSQYSDDRMDPPDAYGRKRQQRIEYMADWDMSGVFFVDEKSADSLEYYTHKAKIDPIAYSECLEAAKMYKKKKEEREEKEEANNELYDR